MNGKKTWMVIGIVVIIALIIVIVALNGKKAKTIQTIEPAVPASEEQAVQPTTPSTLGTNIQDQFRVEVPKDIKVPEVNEKLSEEQAKVIAVPTVVTAAAPGVTEQYRSFNIQANGGVFTPSSVIGNVNDTMHINFTAVDKDYDIVFPSYNMSQTAKKGQTKVLEFQAVQEGSFTFYCETCGGVNSATKGSISSKK